MTPWTTEEVAYLAERSAMRVTARQLVSELNHKFHGGTAVRSYASVTNAKQKYGATVQVSRPDPVDMSQYPTPPELPAPTPIDPIEAERERRERLAMMREEREALTAIAGERSLRKTLEDLVTRVARPFPPPPPYRPPVVKPSKKVTTETVVQMWSDWHAGETVSAEAMRGFNE